MICMAALRSGIVLLTAVQEQVDVMAEADTWRARKKFDRALELCAAFRERLGEDGAEELSLPLPGLPAGASSVTYALQALFVDSGAALRVGGPTALTLD